MFKISVLLLGIIALGFVVWINYDMCKQLKIYEENKNKNE